MKNRFTKRQYQQFVDLMTSHGLTEVDAKRYANTAMQVDKAPLCDKEGKDLDFVASRNMSIYGVILNPFSRVCQMEGCTGHRMHVRWGDGKVTYPCTKSCESVSRHLMKIM